MPRFAALVGHTGMQLSEPALWWASPWRLGGGRRSGGPPIAVAEGNPTNVLSMAHAGLTPQAFLGTMLAPAPAATIFCVTGVALLERRAGRSGRPDCCLLVIAAGI
jgi:hypothetical protein